MNGGHWNTAAVHNTQPVHKSYPGLCTQLVDNSVERLGRTGGQIVGNAGTAGNVHSAPSGIPASGTAAVHKTQALSWADDGFPSFHGPYDYDVLITQESQKPSRFLVRLGIRGPTRQAHTPPAGNFKHHRRFRQEVTREAPGRA